MELKDQLIIHNPGGKWRVVVTKQLPGKRWVEILMMANCRVEVCTSEELLTQDEIRSAIGERCDGAIGQLTESWNRDLLEAFKKAGGKVYSNYAVGYDNVDVKAATELGIPVGNTPGVLTRATAELAVALSFSAARRIVEADSFMRAGKFRGWLPTLFMGELLSGKTAGIIGAGRIGTAYALMMVEGFKMNLIYYDPMRNIQLEERVRAFGEFLKSKGEKEVTCTYAKSVDEVLMEADIVSLHPSLSASTFHVIDARRLGMMKKNAILINTSRGSVIDEVALVEHCRKNPDFRVGLDVYEDEPVMKPGLGDLQNAVLLPHIGSATRWTREGMAVLASLNVSGILRGWPVWHDPTRIEPFLGDDPPEATPSIVNAEELGLARAL